MAVTRPRIMADQGDLLSLGALFPMLQCSTVFSVLVSFLSMCPQALLELDQLWHVSFQLFDSFLTHAGEMIFGTSFPPSCAATGTEA